MHEILERLLTSIVGSRKYKVRRDAERPTATTTEVRSTAEFAPIHPCDATTFPSRATRAPWDMERATISAVDDSIATSPGGTGGPVGDGRGESTRPGTDPGDPDAPITSQLLFTVYIPSLFLSMLFFGSCLSAAVYLRQRASTLRVGENETRGQEIKRALDDALRRLEAAQADDVGPARREVGVLIGRLESLAGNDPPLERRLVVRMRDAYESSPGQGERGGPNGRASGASLDELRGLCRDAQVLDNQRLAASLEAHRQAALKTARGLIAMGTLGSAVGILVGFGIAWRIGRWTRHLSARVESVVRKLDHVCGVPSDEGGTLDGLGVQFESMSSAVEHVLQRLRMCELELQHAERLASLGRLAAGVAHELRNPLFAVKALVQVNKEEAEARGLPSEDLAIIERELRGMEGQMLSLIGMARRSRSGTQVADMTRAARHAVSLFQGRARAQRVRIQVDLPDEETPVPGDPEQIQQVVVNLLQNALDAVYEGGRVEIDVRRAATGQMELVVRDDGPGIDPSVLPFVFQPFVTSKPDGLGIGLAVARRIAESFGGSLSASNSDGGGACFTLRLPASPNGGHAATPQDALQVAAV